MTDHPTFASWHSFMDFRRELSARRRFMPSQETKPFLDTLAAKRDVQSRRERLQEGEDDEDSGYTRSTPEPAESEMSAAQIRSMFASLAADES